MVLRGDRVHVDTAGEHRHAPGLKYMVTELFCHGFGGPEVATSKGFDDAKLAVPVEEWPMFLTLAAEAAEVLPSPTAEAYPLPLDSENRWNVLMFVVLESEEERCCDSSSPRETRLLHEC